MRVGIFSNAYRPIVSGVVHEVDLIRKELLRQGHVPFVFAPRFPGYHDNHAGVWRFCSLDLSRQVHYPLAIPYSPRIFSVIPRLRLDVLHTHHPFLLGHVAGHFAGRLGLPLVYTFHTQYEHYAHYVPLPQDLVRALARRGVKRFARRCDLVLAPSPAIRELLNTYHIGTRVETLPNGIDLSRFPADGQALRSRLGLGPHSLLALYAGRLGQEKNLAFLLEAFASARGPDSHLAIVGDGPLLPSLRELARELAIPVHFLGPVDYKDMPAYFGAADLFVITSTTEVKPLVVLEALASGLPVVAVAACGTADTVTHERDGLLSEGSLEAYRAILGRALGNPALCRALGGQARLSARAYGIEPYTRKLVEFYGEACRRKRLQGRVFQVIHESPRAAGDSQPTAN